MPGKNEVTFEAAPALTWLRGPVEVKAETGTEAVTVAEADTEAEAPAAILPSLLSLLRWVLLPDRRSMSSIASIEAMGAFPLKTKITSIFLGTDK